MKNCFTSVKKQVQRPVHVFFRRRNGLWPDGFATISLFLVLVILAPPFMSPARAHHVLGRPSYALNEDSNTPSSMQVETRTGDYFINYMIFPAFPRPDESGRVNLYIRKLDGGRAYNGKVSFTVQDNSWAAWFGFGSNREKLGAQVIDDTAYHQGFVFKKRGAYIISAHFMNGKMPYDIDFPLQVGAPSSVGPLGMTVALILPLLFGVGTIQRRRALSQQIRDSHIREEQSPENTVKS